MKSRICLPKKKNKIEKLITDKKITWHPLIYSKRPPLISTWRNIKQAKKLARELVSKNKIEIVHCRSYIASLIGMAMQKELGIKFIFDMRGWWADEKKEAGDWSSFIYKSVYKYFKKKERNFFADADVIISLTQKGKEYIESDFNVKNTVNVIPTCVNLDVFKPYDEQKRGSYRAKLGYDKEDLVLIYCGSIGGNYRSDLIFSLFEKCSKQNNKTKLLLLTNTKIENSLLKNKNIQSVSCDYAEVNNYLMAADAGLIFYDNKFSSIGRCPTKLAEYWACDLPFVSALNIADMNLLTEKHPEGGLILNKFTDDEIANVINMMTARRKLRHLAELYFSLENGAQAYNKIYESL